MMRAGMGCAHPPIARTPNRRAPATAGRNTKRRSAMTDQGQKAGSSRSCRRRGAGPRKRPAKLQPKAIADLLSALVVVRTRGVSRRMSAVEASLHAQIKRALIDRDVGAMARIIRLCERHGILQMAPEPLLSTGVFFIPKSWNEAEWRAKFKKHGPPPWPGPRSGLADDAGEDWDERG